MKAIKGDFLAEALDFIVQALEDFEKEKWKFSVLHAGMAVEMALKERLVWINSGAVLENIDNPKCKTTVGMNKMLSRLESFGIELDAADKLLVEQVAEWRNDVAHRKLLADKEIVQEKLRAIYRFFTKFIKEEFDIDVKDKLPDPVYQKYKELLKDWDRVVKEAQAAAKEAGFVDDHLPSATFECPQCWGTPDTLVPVGEKAHCYLCNEDFAYARCLRCEDPVFEKHLISRVDDGGIYCESCLEHFVSQL